MGFVRTTFQLNGRDRRQPGAAGVITADLLGVVREAESITENALAQAQQVLAKAEADAHEIRAQAALRAEREVWKRAHELCTAFEAARHELLGEVERLLTELARALLTRLAAEISDKARIVASVRQLVDEAAHVEDATLHVSPEDMAEVRPLLSRLLWRLKEDSTIASGDCLLTTAEGEWRASFSGTVQGLLQTFAALPEELAGRERRDHQIKGTSAARPTWP
jgi:flagellar biosynthesis/type III secretory pathway protein FliH